VEIGDLLRDTVRLLQAYTEPIRSHALHAFHSASVTMPYCPLFETLARGNFPRVRHSLLSPRAAHWNSPGSVLEAGSEVKGVAISPNGQLVVAGMKSGLLRVWSAVDFEEVALLAGHEDSIGCVAISSDGLRIASGSRDRTIRVWDGLGFEQLGLCKDAGNVFSVAFSPDNSLIASGSPDCAVRIWNAHSFTEVTRLSGHQNVVTSIIFFPDGTRMASGSSDCTVRMWDARTYESLPGIQCSGEVYVIAISPDCSCLAVSEDMTGGTGIIRVYDAVTLAYKTQVQIFPGHFSSQSIVFSPDSDLIASGTGSGAVQVWDASSLRMISTSRGHHGQVTAIAFAAAGSSIVSGSLDGTVRIRPVTSFEGHFETIPGHDGWICQVAYSPDHSRVVSGSLDSTVRIWDGLTCEELAVLTGHDHMIWTVAYSPDGSRVLSGSEDRSIRVWSALDFQEIAVLKGHRGDIRYATFAPDATLIASCSDDRTVRLWSSSTLQELACLEGHRDIVWSVAFSSHGTMIVSVSDDKTVRVWDAVGFTQLAELKCAAHSQDIRSFFAVFSLDDRAIFTRLWDNGPAWVCSDESSCKHISCSDELRCLTPNSQRFGRQSHSLL
jgi:WD40 repeat protein